MHNGLNQADLLNAVPLPCLILLPADKGFIITAANNAFLQIFQLNSGAILEKPIADALASLHPDSLSTLHDSLLKVMKTRMPDIISEHPYQIREKGTDKTFTRYYKVNNSPVFDDSENIQFVLHTIQDIASEQLPVLMNNTEEAFILLNRDLVIVTYNKQFFQLYKEYFGKEISKGGAILNYAQPERKEMLAKLYRQVLTGATEISQMQIPLSGNLVKHFINKYSPVKDEHEKVTGIFVSIRDITEETELQFRQQHLYHELKKRNTYIETVLQHIPIGIAVNKISDGTATFVNKAFSEIYGWLEDDLKDIDSFFHNVYPDEAYRKEITDRILADIESGDPQRMNWRDISITTKTGEERIIHAKNIPLTEQNLMISTVIDNTQAYRQSKEIIRIKNNQEALINNTDDLIWSIDTDYKLIAANNAFIKAIELIAGITLKPGDPLLMEAHFPANYLLDWTEYYHKGLSGNSFRTEIFTPPMGNRNASWADIRFNPVHQSGKITGLACYARDITHEKLGEEKIRRSEMMLSQAQRFAKMGSWTYDTTKNELVWSDELYNLFGVDKNHFQPTFGSVAKLVHPDDRELLLQTNKQTLETGEPYSIQYQITFLDGQRKLLEENGYGQKDSNGKRTFFLGTVQDITEKKKHEEAIKESEAKYRSLVESSMDGILLTTRKGAILSANPAAREMFGMTESEICRSGRKRLVDLTDKRLKKMLKERDQNGKVKGELTFVRSDGSRFPGEISSVVFTDSKGKERTSMIIRDITEIKKAAEELRESNQRFEYATKATSEAIWDWDLLTGKIYWGEGFETIFGYEPNTEKQFISDWLNCIHESDRERVIQKMEHFLSSNESNWSDEYQFLKKGQSYAYIINKGFIIRNEFGKPIKMVGAMQDKTQQKAEEERLKLLESVITNANDAVLITEAEPFDLPGPRIVYVNEAFTRMTGYTAAEVIGKTPRVLQGPKSNSEDLAKLHQALRKWQTCEVTTVNYKKSGEEFWINFIVTPVANEKGWYTHWVAIERDITASKLIEIQLSELNRDLTAQKKELEISNMELEQFAYVASHDLQEPLRMITSFLSQLDKKYGAVIDERGRKYIDFALDGAKRMRQIILDLLEYSRVGKTEHDLEEININELVNEIKILFRKQIAEKKAVITTSKLPTITGHMAPLRQVFQNLFSNALKYSKPDEPCQIGLSATDTGTHWEFALSDNGIGMDKEYFDRIFILFERLHQKNEYSGTGIGLALTKKIVESMGGKIRVDSTVGKGSTFYFTFIKN